MLLKFRKIMNSLIKTLRSELVSIIERIDNGKCDFSDLSDADEIITVIRKVAHRDRPMSKYAACEYLHISRATFDNHVAAGKIPPGVHEQGFKELSWYKKDLDDYKTRFANKKNKSNSILSEKEIK